MKKIYILLNLSVLLLSLLSACSPREEMSQNKNAKQSSEVFTGATSGTDSYTTLSQGLSKHGTWIAAVTNNITASEKTLKVEGNFTNNTDEEARKLALYTQNSEKEVTQRYKLTIKQLEINSPNFYISNGTVKGNVLVNSKGFHGQTGKGINGEATIDGDLIFKEKELLDAYNKLAETEKVKVTGVISVK